MYEFIICLEMSELKKCVYIYIYIYVYIYIYITFHKHTHNYMLINPMDVFRV